jgi:hypothetical protein
VQRKDVDSRILCRFVTGERDAFESAATLVSQTRSRVVDQNPAHQGGRSRKEMCAIAPLNPPLVDEADVHLMDESRWLQRLSSGFTTHLRRRDAPKVVVDEGDQLVKCGTPAFAHGEK